MSDPLLVLDTHYLCHRAFHTTRELSFGGKMTGVLFGFFRTIRHLQDEFQTERVAFCFEHRHLYRRSVYAAYKSHRRNQKRTAEEKKAYDAFAQQIAMLQSCYLPKMGYKNIFCYLGFESDDIMAAIAADYSQRETLDEVILVTADADLYQCLGHNVTIYSPQQQKMLTERWFIDKYGIVPRKWAVVKALAGCNGDEVPGIEGVGEKTALQWLRGELDPKSKVFSSITCPAGRYIVRRNRRLVQLPFEGCPVPNIVEDNFNREGWRKVCEMLGMKSMMHLQ